MDLTIIKDTISKPEIISDVKPIIRVPVQYNIPKTELSENIRKYDKKVERHVESTPEPKQEEEKNYLNTAFDPTYNLVGKFIGVDTLHDWQKTSDKVIAIVDWARRETKSMETDKILKWLSQKAREVPSIGQKKIVDQLYLFARLANKK